MRVGSFSVSIPEAREQESGHAVLAHDSRYTIEMKNHYLDRHCDAEVMVDGKSVGTFRINAGVSIQLERPAHDKGCFTFYRSTSGEAAACGINQVCESDRGLVQVRFRVGQAFLPFELTGGMPISTSYQRSASTKGCDEETSYSLAGGDNYTGILKGAKTRGFSAGITGLSGESRQKFDTVSQLEYQPELETVISIRLVTDDSPRPLIATSRCNPVPAVVV